MFDRFVDARLLSRAEVDQQLEELAAAFEHGGAVFALCMFVASGRVPGGD